MTVLFVDDDIDDREFFIDALSYVDPAISCILAKDCEEALSILETSTAPPEYVFLDINMPTMDGKGCLTVIKKDNRFENVRIVMYSNNSDEQLMAEYKELGATYFLVKPMTFKGLCDSLSILFDR
jgi:DNA-binding response OmpR family regulator